MYEQITKNRPIISDHKATKMMHFQPKTTTSRGAGRQADRPATLVNREEANQNNKPNQQ